MKRIANSLLSVLSLALLAVGCNTPTTPSGDNTGDDLGDEVVVQFGDGNTTIHLRGVTIEQTADGATSVTAEMVSDLPDLYTLQAEFRQDGSFDVLLHNSSEISHTVALTNQQLEAEFMRPSWVRNESVGFNAAALMDNWLQAHIEYGSADCDQVPLAYQDMPLHYASIAILDYLSAEHGVAVDRTRMSRIMCAQGADEAEAQHSRLDYPRGFASWEALRSGNFLPNTIMDELPVYEEPDMVTKNNCPRDIKSASVQTTYATQDYSYAPTHLDLSCSGGNINVDAQCCVDEELLPFSRGTLRKISSPTSSFCAGVLTPSGAAPNFAFFQMSANANICPSAGNSCWGNGVADTATPFSCNLTGFDTSSSSELRSSIGGDGFRQSGIAGWHYLNFSALLCYEHGATTDTVLKHQITVDTNKPSGLICRDTNPTDCYCVQGP